jgi:hypothetical protein
MWPSVSQSVSQCILQLSFRSAKFPHGIEPLIGTPDQILASLELCCFQIRCVTSVELTFPNLSIIVSDTVVYIVIFFFIIVIIIIIIIIIIILLLEIMTSINNQDSQSTANQASYGTVVSLTATKFKSFVFSVLCFTASYVTSNFVIVTEWLLPASCKS